MGLTIVIVFNDQTRKYDVTVGLKYHLLGVPPTTLGELVDKLQALSAIDPELKALERTAGAWAHGFIKA